MTDIPFLGREFGGFKVTGKIGKGGMGVVLKALRESDGTVAAVKVIKEAEAKDPQYIARFEREAAVLRALAHPHILHVFDSGRTPDGTYFIAMEFVDGSSLGDVIKQLKRIPPVQALNVLRQTAGALKSAHERSVVHRDIKPDNILLTRDGRVKLADFGLARDTSDNRRLTLTGQVLGTPAFMSPEQGRGDPADHRSDVYSLGATLYYMLAGERPFSGSTPLEVVVKQIKEVPAPLRAKAPGLPEELYALVERMMAKSPDARFQDYGDIVEAAAGIARAQGWLMAGDASATGVPDVTLDDYEGLSAIVQEAGRAEKTAPTVPAEGEGAKVDSDELVGDTAHPMVGKTIGGKYLVRSKLGEGGMGTVYLVRHTDLKQDFALKVLNPAIAADEAFRERFLREAKAATAFTHKHAVQIRDFGQEGRSLYMTMDFVRGRTLRTILESEKRFSEARAARIGRQVLLALVEAHAAGLIHRDLKPDNLMIEGRGGEDLVRILDFGVAKIKAPEDEASGTGGPSLTRTGTVVGTMQYMSPEQAAGDTELDARSDLYSLAAILYETLAGRRHLEATNIQKMLFKLATEDPEPLSTHAKVSKRLEGLVMRNLSRERDQRSASAADFLSELDACAGLSSTAVAAPPKRAGWLVPAAVAGLVAAAAVVAAIWALDPFGWGKGQGPGDPGRPSAPGSAPAEPGKPAKAGDPAKLLRAAEDAFAAGRVAEALGLFQKARDLKDTDEVRGRIKACTYRLEREACEKARSEKDYKAAMDHAFRAKENPTSAAEQMEIQKIEGELQEILQKAERCLADARSADEAGDLLKAGPLWARYLEEFPKGEGAQAAHERAEAIGKELASFQGLVVRSDPPGATVAIDGKPAGVTPFLATPPGRGPCTLSFELDGYAPKERKVAWEGSRVEVAETLDKEAIGSIRIRSTGAPVEILFQGVSRGKTPVTIEKAPAGEFTFTVRGPGEVAYEVPVRVEAGKSSGLTVDFADLSAKEDGDFRGLPRGETLEAASAIHAEFLSRYPRGRHAAEAKSVVDGLEAMGRKFETVKGLVDPEAKLGAADEYLNAYRGKDYPFRWHIEEVEGIRQAAAAAVEKGAFERIRAAPDFQGRIAAARDYLRRKPKGAAAEEVQALIEAVQKEEKAYAEYKAATAFADRMKRAGAYVAQFPEGVKTREVQVDLDALAREEGDAWAAVEGERDLARRADAAAKYAERFPGLERAETAKKAAQEARAELERYQRTAASAEACREYLDQYPAGSFRAEVEKRLGSFGWTAGEGFLPCPCALPEGMRRGERPGEYAFERDESVMVFVPEGYFPFGTNDFYADGDDKPEVTAWVSGFFIDKYEVTCAKYARFLEWWKDAGEEARARVRHPEAPRDHDPTPSPWAEAGAGNPGLPVTGVDWFAAWAYARWAGKVLPTEAQWEKAATADTARRIKWKYPCGDELPKAYLASLEASPGKLQDAETAPFFSPCGAAHMAGNAAEWCLDPWSDEFLSGLQEEAEKVKADWVVNPCARGDAKGAHAVRGGSCGDEEEDLVVTRRRGVEGRSDKVGFRCAAWLPPAK